MIFRDFPRVEGVRAARGGITTRLGAPGAHFGRVRGGTSGPGPDTGPWLCVFLFRPQAGECSVGSVGDSGNLDNSSSGGESDNPAGGGDIGHVFCIRIAEVESARECLDSGGMPEEEFSCVLMADGVVHAALRRFLDSISGAACRHPVHLDTLERAMLGTLIAAGVPAADLHRALERAVPDAERLPGPTFAKG